MDGHATRWVLIGAATTLMAAGCANQNSIFRVTDTEANKTETILIDAKQRPITVNTNENGKPQTCLARSADALSQAAASGNLKVTQASGGSGELGFADNETVASIAFRTQVTEAQQEFLYTLCQLRANSVLTNAEVSYNLTHFQNMMLAMVAIDDLASSAKAKAADAQKLPAVADPKAAAVKKAQSDADAAKNAATAAAKKVDSDAKANKAVTTAKDLKASTDSLSGSLESYDTKQKSYATLLGKLSDAIKADKGDGAKAPDDMTSATSDAADTAKDVKTAYKKVTDSLAALAKVSDDTKVSAAQTDFSKSLSDYQDVVKQAQDAESGLQKALTAWNAPAAGDKTKDSKVTKAGDQSGATDTGASAAVADSVALIVQTIVWQNFTTEQCQKAMFENFATTADPVKRFCLAHLVKADEIREKQVLGTLVVNNAMPQTPPPN